MKHSIYKTREELPMYLTVMDVADLLGISRARPTSWCGSRTSRS